MAIEKTHTLTGSVVDSAPAPGRPIAQAAVTVSGGDGSR